MKPFLSIIISFTNLICYGQNKYSDLFDLNIKGNPKVIREISIMSLADAYKLNYKDSSLESNLFIDEYYFNSQGIITKEFHKFPYTSGNWINYSNADIHNYRDSIIMIFNDSHGEKESEERRYLNKSKFLMSKIRNSLLGFDSTLYERDTHNRIVKQYKHWFDIDYGETKMTMFELNENGDIENPHVAYRRPFCRMLNRKSS
jgi:hypothetical protein